MSLKEAAIGMGDPYTVYPTGKDFFIPPEIRDGRTLDMGGVAAVLASILATRNAAHLEALKDEDFRNLLRTPYEAVLERFPKVAVLHWNFITQQNNVWVGLVPPTARIVVARVAKGKFGENTWMPVPSGKFDPEKDVDLDTRSFGDIFDAVAYREGHEEGGMESRPLCCAANKDIRTGFLVCSSCSPTNHRYDQEPIRIDSREYTQVMVPTVPALVSMMRKRPDQFTDGVVLSLLQTTEYLEQSRSRAVTSFGDRLKVDLV